MIPRDLGSRWTYNTLSETVRKRSRWMEVLGALLILFGVLALVFTAVSSVVSVLVIGWVLLFAGAAELAATISYWQQRRGGFTVGILLGCLCLIAGVLCLSNPGRSLDAITFILGIYFIGSGIIRLPITVVERFPGWGLGIVAAIVDIVLGILILSFMPVSSLVVPGALLGIQLIISGCAEFMTGAAVRKLLEPRAEPPGGVEPSHGRPATRFQH
jgi:uncharacterized membrane protein HdeD (DUF308 family)